MVASTERTPSLAELVRHHLEVDWSRMSRPPFHAMFAVHDTQSRWLELNVVDADSYSDALYRRGRALLCIGVNGALATPQDEERAKNEFGTSVFRTCRLCGDRFETWLSYYGHVKMDHLGTAEDEDVAN